MRNKSIDRNKIAIILNYLVFIFVVVGLMIMFTGYKISFVKESIMETTKLGALKYFSIESNVLMGLVAIIMAHQERKLLNGNIKKISSIYYILKLVMTTMVNLTLLVVFFYLSRFASGGLISLLQNSNLFFHLIVPLLSLITLTVFERTDKIKFSYTICNLIPVLLYGIFYVFNNIIHLEDGMISSKYDWYWLMQDGINNSYIVAIIIFGITYVIGLLIWILSKKE